jgi:hypothetical protein
MMSWDYGAHRLAAEYFLSEKSIYRTPGELYSAFYSAGKIMERGIVLLTVLV